MLSCTQRFQEHPRLELCSFKQVPWRNENCNRAIKNKNKAFYRYKRHNTLAHKTEFPKHRASARRITKQSKKQAWMEFVQTLNKRTPQHQVWSTTKTIRGTNRHLTIITLISKSNGATEIQAQGTADMLADHLATQSTDSNYDDEFLSIKRQADTVRTEEIFKETDQAINETCNIELHTTVCSCKNSSPGAGYIPYEILEQLPPRGEHILDIHNYMWTQRFPQPMAQCHNYPNPEIKHGQNCA
jgi:hypothetical protein